MPQRKNVTRFKSADIQGDDSWVKVSRLTVGEAREVNKHRNAPDEEAMEILLPICRQHVIDWNWVDDNGEPLPLPRDKPEVIDQLTDLEFAFIGECMGGSEAESKKS